MIQEDRSDHGGADRIDQQPMFLSKGHPKVPKSPFQLNTRVPAGRMGRKMKKQEKWEV